MKDLKQNYSTMFTAYKDVVNVNQLAEMLGIGITLAYSNLVCYIRKEFIMVTENLQQIKVSVSSLVVRNGIYQAVLEYYDENGKRQQHWRSTGLKERGNKKQAMAKAEEIRANLEKN